MNDFLSRVKSYVVEFAPFILFLMCLLGMVLLFSSCRSSKKTVEDLTDVHEYELLNERISSYRSTIDSLYSVISSKDSVSHVFEERDSTYQNTFRSDTLIVRDSVSVQLLADGSSITERWHNELRTIFFRDTLFRYRDAYTYIDEFHAQEQLANHLQSYSYVLEDSITHLRDSIANRVQNSTEVIQKKIPTFVSMLAYIGALALLSAVIWVVFKLKS